MSYLPMPPRVWSRVQNQCTYLSEAPLTNQIAYENKLIYKGNILQYKANSSKLSKKQIYSQMAKGMGPNRTKVFATQSETYTNPNTTIMLRKNYITYPYPNQIVNAPNNPSGPFQCNVKNPFDCSNNNVQDGGYLMCGTYANPCTDEVIKKTNNFLLVCNPSYCSNVPGYPINLCWINGMQTWYPKTRYVMNNSSNKWPEGYKGFVSACHKNSFI